MLSVSFNLTTVVTMFMSIVLPIMQIDIDILNSPTARPIPNGRINMGANQSAINRDS